MLLSLISIALIILIFLVRNFRWIIREIRSICMEEKGYIKFIQLLFVLLIFTSFFILLIYNLIYREETSKLDIFLTVIVGLIGTIVGTFFSERTTESIKRDRDIKKKIIRDKKKNLEEHFKNLDKLFEALD